MPRFEYKCSNCEETQVLVHASGEEPENVCNVCGEPKLERLYSFTISKKVSGDSEPGTVVKSFIEEAREEVIKEKKVLQKKEYKP
jgi:putative FmdB family regulatory protein